MVDIAVAHRFSHAWRRFGAGISRQPRPQSADGRYGGPRMDRARGLSANRPDAGAVSGPVARSSQRIALHIRSDYDPVEMTTDEETGSNHLLPGPLRQSQT